MDHYTFHIRTNGHNISIDSVVGTEPDDPFEITQGITKIIAQFLSVFLRPWTLNLPF